MNWIIKVKIGLYQDLDEKAVLEEEQPLLWFRSNDIDIDFIGEIIKTVVEEASSNSSLPDWS